MPKNHDIILWR